MSITITKEIEANYYIKDDFDIGVNDDICTMYIPGSKSMLEILDEHADIIKLIMTTERFPESFIIEYEESNKEVVEKILTTNGFIL